MRVLSLIILIILFAQSPCFGQNWSIHGGVVGAYFTKRKVSSENDLGNYIQTDRETHVPMLGGSLGANFQFKIGNRLLLRTGADVNYLGSNLNTYFSVDYTNTNYWYTSYNFDKMRILSAGLPISLMIPFHTGKTSKYFLLGGEVNANIMGWFQQDHVHIAETVQYVEQDRTRRILFGNEYNSDMVRFNYALNAGIGMTVNHISYELLFSHGLKNVVNPNVDPYETFYDMINKSWRQVYFKLSVSYLFGEMSKTE